MTSTMMMQRGSQAMARFSRDHPRLIMPAVALATIAAIVRDLLPMSVVDGVSSAVGSWMSAAASALTWTTVLSLSVIIGVQYVAATLSARAAAGVALPFGELLATQFAATAANSVTPVGLGGVTVTGRYFARRGRLRPSQAAAAVSALAVFGGAADVIAFALLIGVGSLLGVEGASGEVPLLVDRLTGAIPRPNAMWIWVAAAIGAGILVIASTSRDRRARVLHRVVDGARAYRRTAAVLVRQPWRMAVLMSTSASTTLLMAGGFAAIATLGPAGLPLPSFAALMIGYMVASAAGNALPAPGGIGTADAALTGVLLAAHVPVATAVGTVLAYRLITFWAPVVIGVALIHPLRRRGAL